jgi:hypothetical protein
MIDLQAYLARLAGGTPITTSQWDGDSAARPSEKQPPAPPLTGVTPAESPPGRRRNRNDDD